MYSIRHLSSFLKDYLRFFSLFHPSVYLHFSSFFISLSIYLPKLYAPLTPVLRYSSLFSSFQLNHVLFLPPSIHPQKKASCSEASPIEAASSSRRLPSRPLPPAPPTPSSLSKTDGVSGVVSFQDGVTSFHPPRASRQPEAEEDTDDDA